MFEVDVLLKRLSIFIQIIPGIILHDFYLSLVKTFGVLVQTGYDQFASHIDESIFTTNLNPEGFFAIRAIASAGKAARRPAGRQRWYRR